MKLFLNFVAFEIKYRNVNTFSLVLFSILNLLSFNWRIIALPYCVGFCHTST